MTRLHLISTVSSMMALSLPASAQIEGQGTSLQPSGVVCRNLATGQRVLTTASGASWNCEDLGLEASIGDRVETGMRGSVPLDAEEVRLDLRTLTVPEDFAVQFVSEQLASEQHVGDFDGDGDLDLLGRNPLFWYESSGGASPTFTEHSLASVAGSVPVTEVTVYDVDKDGRLDFVGVHGFHTARWFRNEGGSPLRFARMDISLDFPWEVGLPLPADLDGDGDTDFVFGRFRTIDFFDSELVWAEAVGNETYVLNQISPDIGGPWPVDLDGDGDIDIIRTRGIDQEITWFENDGTGTFVEHPPTLVSGSISPVRSADFDGDGDPDLVAPMSDPDFDTMFSWFENISGGQFIEHFITMMADSAELVLGDFSGDGLPDLVTQRITSGEARWIENRGGSPVTFLEHPLLPAGNNVGFDDTGDIDGDGRLDLVAENGGIQVEWYRNQIGLRLSVSGMSVRGFLCRNRTTGQSIRVSTIDTAIDCENEGLTVSPGDEVEVFARGQAE